MKSLRLIGLPVLTTVLFLFSSCGGGEEKTRTDTMSTDTVSSVTPTEPMPTSTIINTPQHMMIVKHRVSNYAKWKPSYDQHDSLRLVNGIHSYVIGRSVQDSNMILVAVKADDMAKAKAFANDPSLKKAMKEGGVTGTPNISFVTMTFQDTGMVNAAYRSETKFTVKDWATWQKGFEDGRQERIDNGLADRAYGHDPDNDKKVTLVVAITDSAKAAAYWNSDMLKERRAKGGVIGTPERFIFRVVQRY